MRTEERGRENGCLPDTEILNRRALKAALDVIQREKGLRAINIRII